MSQADSAYNTLEELRARPALRANIECAVDRLIALLNDLDGDPEAEPWLGWTADGQLADTEDREPNGDEQDYSDGGPNGAAYCFREVRHV